MKLFLIGGNDSIGVPYSRDNKDNIGFFDLISEELAKNYDLIKFNFFHMSTYNTNQFIWNCLKDNYSLRQVKENQNKMLKKCKYSGIYPFIELPKSFLNFYRINKNDENVRIRDELIRNDSMFIYSSGVNDFLKSNKSSLFKMLFPKNIENNLSNVEKIIDQCIVDMNRNISYIRKALKNPIDLFNRKVESLCDNYDTVYYVNNSNLERGDFCNIDFPPNRKGHQKIYQNFMKIYNKRT